MSSRSVQGQSQLRSKLQSQRSQAWGIAQWSELLFSMCMYLLGSVPALGESGFWRENKGLQM